jgi:hypothetical protein
MLLIVGVSLVWLTNPLRWARWHSGSSSSPRHRSASSGARCSRAPAAARRGTRSCGCVDDREATPPQIQTLRAETARQHPQRRSARAQNRQTSPNRLPQNQHAAPRSTEPPRSSQSHRNTAAMSPIEQCRSGCPFPAKQPRCATNAAVAGCSSRTKAAARAPAPMRSARAIPIVRHGARRTGPARSPRRHCDRAK